MKYILLSFFALAGWNASAQKPTYDAALAGKLGGNDIGMRSYILVILKTGTAPAQGRAVQDSLFAAHMDNIDRLADEGKLVVAGPFGKNEQGYRGIFVLTAKSVDEARAIVATDPAVKANLLSAEYIPWYSSAALMEVPAIHERIVKP